MVGSNAEAHAVSGTSQFACSSPLQYFFFLDIFFLVILKTLPGFTLDQVT